MPHRAFGRDVPEQTRQLIELLDKNRHILKSTDDGVVIFDSDGRVAAANPAAARLLRQSASDIAGCDINQVIDEKTESGNRAGKAKLPRGVRHWLWYPRCGSGRYLTALLGD